MYDYNPTATEAKWQKAWDEAKTYEVDLKKAKDPYYSLVMFPYPSGDRLHVGHWYNFAPADSWARYIRMRGKDVFCPMGFDAFGLPAENYAIKTGVHPSKSIHDNVQTMIAQLKRMGCMYDWSKMVNTSLPEYYRWTQWLFLKMFEKTLAYKKTANVNYCPKDQTVLANEQVKEGKCERCGTDVVQKSLEQWFWKITEYSQRLLDGLKNLDWPEKTKLMQEHWIGKSEGAEIEFEVAGHVSCGINSAANMTSATRTVHLTFSPHKRFPLFEDVAHASAILRILQEVAAAHNIHLHEAIAMPDHIHLLISFDAGRHLEMDVVKNLKGASARKFAQMLQWDVGQHVWERKKHFEAVTNNKQFQITLEYLRKNPLEAKISSKGRILSEFLLTLKVFTTRPDTLFGVTYIVLAPEHPLVEKITPKDHWGVVHAYRESVKKKTEIQRTDLNKDKTGEPTGAYAIHPVTREKIPIWIADYVLGNYGTGAVMAVPAHDERDFAFAQTFHLPLKKVVSGGEKETPFTGEGKAMESEFLNNLATHEAKKKMIAWLEDNDKGRSITQYRLRDWLVSRQRYWGAPIPIVYDPEGNAHPVPEKHLPWLLPTDVEFKPTGESPLVHSKEFKERTEKIFGKGWRPEYDTMDTFVCSSFYYLRYLASASAQKKSQVPSPKSQVLVDPSLEKKWLPVSMYIGGPEHACMHLIYARFVMMALHDMKIVSRDEPFQRLVHQGLITNKGAKMSKSKGNVVSPDAFVERHGSDVFRMFLMFMGPFMDGGDWSDTGIKGIDRFVQRVWKLFSEPIKKGAMDDAATLSALHATIKKVTESIERLQFNTAISALMEFLNLAEKQASMSKETMQTFIRLLAPLAPHLSEELWELSGGKNFVIDQKWPTYDPKILVTDSMTIVVQVNGKLRASLEVSSDADEKDILKLAKANENVKKFLTGPIKKEIYVKGKLVSLVV